ncbi:Protein N-acetyltransferase, RimJ/RimL family [Allokutzneria albata]|uniref:Protein N-acetyltransferase, RimJ/RimL family n=1 Tax=Allokutzneria albata TaxID=211114 RepID=A0A1G9U4Z0_ALLAB|nr:Protein N-acetyltransferase, RimJ/RimL family [Allokutzneria albata]
MHLNGVVFDALAAGDLAAANAASPVPLSAYFAGPDWRSVWRMRSEQVAEDPASADWVTGVIWDEDRELAVGRAGYHGPPDAAGMVEIGYAVDPAHRRRGYARAALEFLLRRAADEPDVRTVRVTISPDNEASYRLAAGYGFVEVGKQWDEEDGLEIIYEVAGEGVRPGLHTTEELVGEPPTTPEETSRAASSGTRYQSVTPPRRPCDLLPSRHAPPAPGADPGGRIVRESPVKQGDSKRDAGTANSSP